MNKKKITVRAGSYSSVVKGLLNLHEVPGSQKTTATTKNTVKCHYLMIRMGKNEKEKQLQIDKLFYIIHNYINLIIKQLF